MSQTLTLYITPVAYIYLDRLQQWIYGRRRVAVAPAVANPGLVTQHET